MSTSGCAASAAPTSGPVPLTRLNTPAGTPASCTTSANSSALSGDSSLGLSTTVHPAASAGPTFAVIWYSGQFHGVIRPHTPMASRTMAVSPRVREEGIAAGEVAGHADVLGRDRHLGAARHGDGTAHLLRDGLGERFGALQDQGRGCGRAARPGSAAERRRTSSRMRAAPRPRPHPTSCALPSAISATVCSVAGSMTSQRCGPARPAAPTGRRCTARSRWPAGVPGHRWDIGAHGAPSTACPGRRISATM